MKSKHTTGSWRYSKEYQLVTASKYGLIEGSKTVCDLNENVSFGENKGELEANGVLIASAPDMLNALKKIEALCDNTNAEHEAIWRIAFDALSKATRIKL